MPMTKAMKKKITGKKTVAAASASTPIMWPRKTLLIVPESDCSTFASIIGARKTRKVRHSGSGAFGVGARGGLSGCGGGGVIHGGQPFTAKAAPAR